MLDRGRNIMEEPFAEALERYLGETLHDRIRVSEFRGAFALPSFLERTYRLYETQIAGRRCVFVTARENMATPSDIAKHIGLVRSAVDAVVVFAVPSLSAHNRSRLLGHGVAFVVPGNQLYIPDLAMDLREHFRAPKLQDADGLSPAAQAVLFHHLLRPDESASTPSLIAKRLHYSAMSIGRAFDDLVAVRLAETEKHGKERHIRFKSAGRQLLEVARDHLRSPVRAMKFVKGALVGAPLKTAGESALAELTDLSRPRMDAYAVAASAWKTVARDRSLVETDRHDADYMVETWSYDPAGLSDMPTVDPLSLYAQFKDHSDERVAAAAERLLEGLPWL
jgi:DNA-binding MarR family transcriptional regulator